MPRGPRRTRLSKPYYRTGILLMVSLGLLATLGVIFFGKPRAHRDSSTGGRLPKASPVTETAATELDSMRLSENYVEAFVLLSRRFTEQSAALGPNAELTLSTLQQIGAVAHLSGDQALAEELSRIALQRRREILGDRHPDVAESLYWRGLTAQYHMERALAGQCFREAMDILGSLDQGRSRLAGSLTQASASLLRFEGLLKAIDKYREALEIRKACFPRPSIDLADNKTWLAWCLYQTGQFDEALRLFEDAGKDLVSLGVPGHSLNGTILNIRGHARAMEGDWPGAEDLYRRTAELFEARRGQFLTGFARRRIPVDGFDCLALALLMQGRSQEAWESLARARAHLSVDFVALGQWKRTDPEGYQRVAALRKDYFQERRRYLEGWSRSAARLPDDAWESLVRSLDLYARIQRIERDYLSVQRRLRPDYEAIRGQLDDNTALVGWLLINAGADDRRSDGDLRAWAWAYIARRDRPVEWVPLWEARGASELRDVFADSRRYMKRRNRAADWATTVVMDRELTADARDVSRKWFDPLLPHLEGADRLLIDASTMPFQIPIDAFYLPDGGNVCDRFSLSYLPSLTAMAHAGASPVAAAEPCRTALAIGAKASLRTDSPLGEGLAGPGGLSVSGKVLPAIPETEFESGSVAALFQTATLLQNGDASESRLLEMAEGRSLAGFDVIHIATHSAYDVFPERSAFVLGAPDSARNGQPDGYVEAREILGLWDLNARVVTLSGCESSSWTGFGRGEFQGMAAAMFGAGARAIVGSQWPVQDRATSLFMVRFYENLLGSYSGTRMGVTGRPIAMDSALREAKIWLRDYVDSGGARPFEHPVYWSGFLLVGYP